MTQDIAKLTKALDAAAKAQAEIDHMCHEADQQVKAAQDALDAAKEARRVLYESLGKPMHRGRPKGSKNKAKAEPKEEDKHE